MTVETLEAHACFGGTLGYYRHVSAEIGLPMRFGLYLPPQAAHGPVPLVTYLAGLTCDETTFLVKAGAPRAASALGLALLAPDTSPRGAGIPGEADDWEFGVAAGFYVDATAAPWSAHWRMYSYVTRELPALVAARFPVREDTQGVFGHSMGGHGALVAALRERGRYRSASAFAPIAAPSEVPWGEKAFSRYLGPDRDAWAAWDASALLRSRGALGYPVLVDQGEGDKFLASQLRPEQLAAAAAATGQALTLRRHAGYDHSYWFVQSFLDDHLRYHAARLR